MPAVSAGSLTADIPATERGVEGDANVRGPASRPVRARGADDQRSDIQALRAVAVGLVILNHLWPGRLTGGYIGVDVFFVISGFLITSGLVSRPPQRPRDLAAFWGRRVRRLLPAACLVLILTVLAAAYWGPQTMIPNTARQATASAFYVQNWVLAGNATDYFAAGQTTTAVQHFWSLSVEEQFYLAWPILILVLAWLARRLGWRFAFHVGLAVILVVSFTLSVWYTARQPSAAYFVTYTRAWELATGGLLAVFVVRGFTLRPRALRAVLAWCGLVAIAISAVTLSAQSAFPGAVAAVPVLGTALVIAVRSDGVHGGPWMIWRIRPVQVLGDISYSVYLWHLPIIMIAPAALHVTLTWKHKLVLIVAVLGLSWLSKHFIEDTFRYRPGLVKSLPRTFIMGLTAMLLVVAASTATTVWAQHLVQEDRQRIGTIAKGFPERCIGAGMQIVTGCPSIAPDFLFVSPADTKENPWLNCNTFPPYAPASRCSFGAPAGPVRVLLIGNSHANQWAPLLDTLGKKQGWAGVTMTASGCMPYIGMTIDYGPDTDGCKKLGDAMLAEAVSGHYDLVIYSSWPNDPIIGRDDHWPAVAESQLRVFDAITSAGVGLLVIRDTPHAVVNLPDCISSHRADMNTCDYPDLTGSQSVDSMYAIASASTNPKVWTVNVNDLICEFGMCHAVVGGLITYHDDNHLSVAFANSLAPRFEPVLEEALG